MRRLGHQEGWLGAHRALVFQADRVDSPRTSVACAGVSEKLAKMREMP